MLVEEYDEGYRVPFYFEVADFRNGYFIANLDRELAATLTVISYNENGSVRSNTITIPALGYPEEDVEFNTTSEYVEVKGLTQRQIENGRVSYVITTPLNQTGMMETGILSTERRISTSELSQGIYVLSLIRDGEVVGTTKFVK